MYLLHEKCTLITETSPMSHVTVSVYTVHAIKLLDVEGPKCNIVDMKFQRQAKV